MPIATRLHSLRRLDIDRTHSLSAAMLEALLESSVQGCSLRVVLQPGQHKGLSAEVCESTWAAVAGRRGRRLTPMLSCPLGLVAMVNAGCERVNGFGNTF